MVTSDLSGWLLLCISVTRPVSQVPPSSTLMNLDNTSILRRVFCHLMVWFCTSRPSFVEGQPCAFPSCHGALWWSHDPWIKVLKKTIKFFLPRRNTHFIGRVNDRNCFSMPALSLLLLDAVGLRLLLSTYSHAIVKYALFRELFTWWKRLFCQKKIVCCKHIIWWGHLIYCKDDCFCCSDHFYAVTGGFKRPYF